MLKLAFDENVHAAILSGLRRRAPEMDLVRVQDRGLAGADDKTVLAWAAREGRVLITHDVRTMFAPANARVDEGLAMPGVIVVPWGSQIGPAIDILYLIAAVATEDELASQVRYLAEFR